MDVLPAARKNGCSSDHGFHEEPRYGTVMVEGQCTTIKILSALSQPDDRAEVEVIAEALINVHVRHGIRALIVPRDEVLRHTHTIDW